ncbi:MULTISPECIES: hypothetical protein [Paenibacillus]|uniref:hypothetical protein n=1 Tax=Paenibacillus TaxID=44249 RepID=UPI00168BC969|nr:MULTISPECIES: hypothetical protein [Paenibacillus]
MNHSGLGSIVGRLPMATAGIVHAFGQDGRSLSFSANLIANAHCEMSFLPS